MLWYAGKEQEANFLMDVNGGESWRITHDVLTNAEAQQNKSKQNIGHELEI